MVCVLFRESRLLCVQCRVLYHCRVKQRPNFRYQQKSTTNLKYHQTSTIQSQLRQRLILLELCVRGHQIWKSPSPHTGATRDCWSPLFAHDVVRCCTKNRILLRNLRRVVIKPVKVSARKPHESPLAKGPGFRLGAPAFMSGAARTSCCKSFGVLPYC